MLHLPPHAPPSPPFDASTFDSSTLSEDSIRNTSRDPDLCLLDQRKHDWVRRTKTYGVTPSVLALGKNPYPGLRVTRPIPELNQDTPAYDPFKPWFGDSYILNRLTPSRLLEEGCININTGVFAPISPRFCIDGEVATRASQATTDPGLYIGNHDGIHPVVGRNQFHLTSDYEYECLKPTLRVVTKMLEMDSVLDMLWALGSRWTQEVPTKMKKDIYVYYTGRSTHVQRMETAWELEQLSNHVHFEWGEISTLSGAQAKTFYVESKPGLRGGVHARGCRIVLDQMTRYVLTVGSATLASLYNPQASDNSSFLRTQLLLATTIVHELAHVWRISTNKLPFHCWPFCNDNRVAEEGSALETAIHKGVILEPNHANPHLKTTPFGMVAWKWPGLIDMDYYNDKTRRSVHEDGVLHHTWYMIKMEYIRQFFSDDFWNQRHLRFGDGALSDFAAIGLRHVVINKNDPQKRIKTIGLELEADEWMPDVVESGIVYRDKVIDYSSGKEIAKRERTAEETYMDELANAFVVKDVQKLKAGMKDKMGSPGKSSPKKSKKKTGKKY